MQPTVSWRNLIWMVVALCLAGLALLLARRQPLRLSPQDPALDDLAGAFKAYKLISRQGYTGIEPDRACRGAIDGMVRQVDEFSVYIPPGKVAPFNRRSEGTWIETGLRITAESNRLFVVGPAPGSPAHKAGLFGGLEILAIDGVEAAYLTLDQARKLLTPIDRRPVTLRLRKTGGGKFTCRLTPDRTEIETVTGIVRDEDGQWRYVLDGAMKIFYVRIGEFLDRTPGELQKAYRRLGRPRGLVLDLRDNPGGLLSSAVEVVDRFIEEGLIVRTAGRRNEQHTYYAHADGTYPPTPMVVLINERTTSAAEIVAGALQLHERAVLLGGESYGKWSVQSTFDLGHGLGKIYLTTGEYFLAEPPATQPATTAARAPVATSQAQPATQPHLRRKRSGLRPDVPTRLTVAQIERLKLLRLEAMVAVRPPVRPLKPAHSSRRSFVPGFRSVRLKRSILEADAQLAKALKLLRNLPLPTTRPSRGGHSGGRGSGR